MPGSIPASVHLDLMAPLQHLVQTCTQVQADTVGLAPYQSRVSGDAVYYYPCPAGNPSRMYFISNHARKSFINMVKIEVRGDVVLFCPYIGYASIFLLFLRQVLSLGEHSENLGLMYVFLDSEGGLKYRITGLLPYIGDPSRVL